MAWPVYSERFLARQFVPAAAAVYNIPSGTRLLLTHICMVNQGPGIATVDARVGGIKVYRRGDLAVDANITFVTRAVGYEGEQLYLYSSGDGFAVSCHGYLLSTSSSSQEPAGSIDAPLSAIPPDPMDGNP